MTDTDISEVHQRDLLRVVRDVYSRSVWLNAADRNLHTGVTRVLNQSLAELYDASGLKKTTFEELVAATTYPDSAERPFTRHTFNAFEAFNAGWAPADRFAKGLAMDIDNKIGAVVSGLDYDQVDGLDNDNDITAGHEPLGAELRYVHLKRVFPWHADGSFSLVVRAVRDAVALLIDKGVLDGEHSNEYGPAAFCYIAPNPVAHAFAECVYDKLQIRNQGSSEINRRGIFGTSGYLGTYQGLIDIAGTNSLPYPTADEGGQDWASYVIPTDATLLAGFTELAGTDGDDVSGEWFVGVPQPEHIIRVGITSS